MKVHDLVFIPHKIYMEIMKDFTHKILTDDMHDEMGLKYYCTESDKFAKIGESKQYVFEVLDAKKVILAKLKYSF